MKNKQRKEATMIKRISCLSCASRCGMLLHTEKGKVTKIEGDPKHPISRGWTCSWGRAAVVSRYRQGLYNSQLYN